MIFFVILDNVYKPQKRGDKTQIRGDETPKREDGEVKKTAEKPQEWLKMNPGINPI
jgi:hypothetical protein